MTTVPVGAVAIFVAAAAVLAWGIESAGVAAPYSDPIARIRAQDEVFYVNSAIRMTQDGDWLNPKVMGRLFLFKPPLLMWMSAACVRVAGVSLAAVRFPSWLLGAAGIVGLYLWGVRARSPAAGFLAAALLLLSPLWQTFSRLCYTDVPGSVFVIFAPLAVVYDPRMERSRTPIAAGIFGAAAILTKSIAGLIPFAAIGLYWLVTPSPGRPRFKALLLTAATAAALLAPWHIYQIITHPKWFYADYVQVQLLGVGLTASRNGIFDRPAIFYLERLLRLNPLPLLFIVLAFRRTGPRPAAASQAARILALCWTATTVLALAAFQARNVPYLVFLLPPLCITAAAFAPDWILTRPIRATAAAVALTALFAVAAPIETAPPIQGASAMRTYQAMNRDTELIACAPDDEFYGTLIPLRRVRYCFVDPQGSVGRIVPHYPALGIVLTADQFLNLPQLQPAYESRLAEWGLHSDEPIGTSMTLATPKDLSRVLAQRPDLDAYIPAEWKHVIAAAAATHELRPYSETRTFLLSRRAHLRSQPAPPVLVR